MPATVTLRVTAGCSAGNEYRFTEHNICIVGRAEDCDARIDAGDECVSRHHCLFDINPPGVRVRDLGSLNGTRVNGEEIGRPRRGQSTHELKGPQLSERDLVDGDEIAVGSTVLRVGVSVPAPSELPTPPQQRCERCGCDLSGEADARMGAIICALCRRDVAAILADLLRSARAGSSELGAIRGYEIVRELGRGGQGVVYLARHEDSGELMALKVLLAEVAVDPRARDGFLREIESTRALRHPNVVEFRDSGASGSAFFFTGEYCDGGSVATLVAERGGRLAIEEAVSIVLQALDGLAYAHTAKIPAVRLADGTIGPSRGLVHRDIKPSNILLAGSGSARAAKLADFGLAKAFDRAGLSRLTSTGARGGTFEFMARTQIVNYRMARPEVDVWAIAASLYWMLTLAVPRDFPPAIDPVAVVLQGETMPIRHRLASIPRRLAEVIDTALIDGPLAIATAEELKCALQAAL